VIVGVNRYQEDDVGRVELHRIDPESERRQLERTARVRAERDPDASAAALVAVREAAVGGDTNLLPVLRDALRAYCTIGEVCETLRAEWGMYDTLRARA
jgi:methylmalonyl-CoA mutase, N-terminal domain